MVHQVLEPMVKLFSSNQISTVEVCVCVVSDQKLISFVEVLICFMTSIWLTSQLLTSQHLSIHTFSSTYTIQGCKVAQVRYTPNRSLCEHTEANNDSWSLALLAIYNLPVNLMSWESPWRHMGSLQTRHRMAPAGCKCRRYHCHLIVKGPGNTTLQYMVV